VPSRLTERERHSPRQNELLAALPPEDYERLRPHMTPVELRLGEVVYESGSAQRHVYFPVSGIVSRLYIMENGDSAEIAVVGKDGMVGVSVMLGGDTTTSRAVVQVAAKAYKVSSDAVLREFRRGGAMQFLILRYVQALMTQMSQTAVCNRHHTVEQQLCRWLLLSLDLLGSNEIAMTQELISNMLGVRRPGITEAARNLQQAGLIEYHRGHIRVLDRARLEAHSCECYAVVQREAERLLHAKIS
jgi:CRP-like cAMP-binding protein